MSAKDDNPIMNMDVKMVEDMHSKVQDIFSYLQIQQSTPYGDALAANMVIRLASAMVKSMHMKMQQAAMEHDGDDVKKFLGLASNYKDAATTLKELSQSFSDALLEYGANGTKPKDDNSPAAPSRNLH